MLTPDRGCAMRRLFLSLALLASLLAPALPAFAAPAPHTWVFVIGGVGTTADSSMADFGTLATALNATMPAGSWTMADLGYNGLYRGVDGPTGLPTWYTAPYAPCDTVADIWHTRDVMAASLAAFASAHPGARIVLVGHSLGGFLAYYMATSPLAPRIAANVSIDAPLGGASESAFWASPPGCQSDMALVELENRGQMAQTARTADLTSAYDAGATSRNVGVVANMADCLYDLDLPNCPLFGSDWRGTMFAPADWTGTYNDVVEGVGSIRAEISTPHAAILHDYAAMLDVARFLAR